MSDHRSLDLSGYDDEALDTFRGQGPTTTHWVLYAAGAVLRRKVLVLAVFLLGVAASIAYYWTRPTVYRVEAKVLAQRSQAMPSVGRSQFEDMPTRSAWELIHRRDNLIALVKQTGLLAAAPAQPPASRFRIWLSRSSVAGSAARGNFSDPLDAMVLTLDRQLAVLTEDGTITIRLDWPDPQEAHAIVEAALQNFLEARHLQEVTAIDEVISVLQGRAAVLRKNLEDAISAPRKRPAVVLRSPPRVSQPSEELVRLQSTLEAKKRAIQDVEEFRRRRLSDLDAQLAQARNVYSDVHPTVKGLRDQIEALKRESPQVEALREEELKLRKEYGNRLAREGVSASTVAAPIVEPVLPTEEDERVRAARLQYDQIDARVGTVQAERDAARAAFKFRYNVIWPPQIPREPVGPNPLKLLGGGVIASLLAALAAAAAPDVLRGRVVERWQVERSMDVPIIGEWRKH